MHPGFLQVLLYLKIFNKLYLHNSLIWNKQSEWSKQHIYLITEAKERDIKQCACYYSTNQRNIVSALQNEHMPLQTSYRVLLSCTFYVSESIEVQR